MFCDDELVIFRIVLISMKEQPPYLTIRARVCLLVSDDCITLCSYNSPLNTRFGTQKKLVNIDCEVKRRKRFRLEYGVYHSVVFDEELCIIPCMVIDIISMSV